LDAGTAVRDVLFNITISEKRPKKIIIIDAIDCQKKPGEVFTIPIENLPENKIDDFSLHQLPTSNLLKELKELCNVEVILVGVQPDVIPDSVKLGLSKKLKSVIPKACEYIVKNIIRDEKNEK
jgi:coenzyme F420 hydrogenase subunit delta